MAKSNSTLKNLPKSPAKDDPYDRLVTEVASLECVLDTLVTHDLSGGRQGHLASAELLLRETIGRLHEFTSVVEHLRDAATEREVTNG